MNVLMTKLLDRHWRNLSICLANCTNCINISRPFGDVSTWRGPFEPSTVTSETERERVCVVDTICAISINLSKFRSCLNLG